MTVILTIVPQIKSKLNSALAQSRGGYTVNWIQNKVILENVLGIYEVDGTEPLTKFRFRTDFGSDEVIIANANFTIRSIE